MVIRTRWIRTLLLTALLVGFPLQSFAQMDMLPQIFRDLPPEIEQGLPQEMTFEEYRALNRNVDFFTMFMSMFVPGYGLFSVERPDLGWPVFAARMGGYGLMTAAVVLQWNHFQDFASSGSLSTDDFNRLLTNSFIFGGGVVVAGLSWAADVVLAYHIAKQEKDLVQYQYGIRTTVARNSASVQQRDQEYLQSLLAQPSDRAVRDELLLALPSHAERFPDAAFAAQALLFTGLLHAESGNDRSALAFAMRSAYLYPEGAYSDAAVRLAARLLERNPQWDETFELAAELVDLPSVSLEPELRLVALSNALYTTSQRDLHRIGVEASEYALKVEPLSPYSPQVLATVAYGYELLDEPARAAEHYAMIALRHLDSELWEESVLRLITLYEQKLDDPVRVAILSKALLERSPNSPQADQVRARSAE
jgi:hypothetical protein